MVAGAWGKGACQPPEMRAPDSLVPAGQQEALASHDKLAIHDAHKLIGGACWRGDLSELHIGVEGRHLAVTPPAESGCLWQGPRFLPRSALSARGSTGFCSDLFSCQCV